MHKSVPASFLPRRPELNLRAERTKPFGLNSTSIRLDLAPQGLGPFSAGTLSPRPKDETRNELTADCTKDLVGVPWRVAIALQADGWYLRSEIIWHKPNPLPESVKDRPTSAHETIFLLSKNAKYFYDYEAIKERGVNGKRRNKRSVWTIQTEPISEAHFATFPTKLIEPCILAGSKEGDLVIDPFFGSGTTGLVAALHGRNFIGVELKPEYIEIARKRLRKYGFTFNVIGSGQSGE
jgi:hypothetical protein